ncbi:hypothetical protein V2G26_015628 [Clonostachys chloroleuca]
MTIPVPRSARQRWTHCSHSSMTRHPTSQISVAATIITAPGLTAAVTIEIVYTPADTHATTTADTVEPDESLTLPTVPPPLPAVHHFKVFISTPEKWSQVFNDLCTETAPNSKNNTAPSIIRALTDDLAFAQPTAFGYCKPIPRGAIPMALFFLDYVQETERLALPATDPARPKRRMEENKRRIAAKCVLRRCHASTFPSSGDSRLH